MNVKSPSVIDKSLVLSIDSNNNQFNVFPRGLKKKSNSFPWGLDVWVGILNQICTLINNVLLLLLFYIVFFHLSVCNMNRGSAILRITADKIVGVTGNKEGATVQYFQI